MIDLHIHSNCSDGVLSPIEIFKKAENIGLEFISITDHDTCRAYEVIDGININDYYSGKLITGCELRTSHKKVPIEILGYNVNPSVINEWKDKYYSEEKVLRAKNKNLSRLKDVCRDIGLAYDEEIVVKNVKESFARNLYLDLIKYEQNKKYFGVEKWFSLEVFLRKYCSNPESQFFVDRTGDYPDIKEVTDVIRTSGGLSFLAHPYEYRMGNCVEFIKSILSRCKIDGIECFYTTFTKDQIY